MIARDDIISLAHEAGFSLHVASGYADQLEKFAALIANKERKECIKVAEGVVPVKTYGNQQNVAILTALRARGLVGKSLPD
jgi:hypothetical protein